MPSALVDTEFFEDFDDPADMWDSNGRPLSKEQAVFFSGSKCISNDGTLLTLYHASNSDFLEFSTKYIGSGGGSIFGRGFYFCDSKESISIYGKYIKECYLNLKNPFRWEIIEEKADATYNLDMFIEVLEANNFEVTDDLREELEELVIEEGLLDEVIERTCGVGLVQKYFIRAGYDGIMNLDVGDYVAFDPKQIKLCSNKEPTSSANIAA